MRVADVHILISAAFYISRLIHFFSSKYESLALEYPSLKLYDHALLFLHKFSQNLGFFFYESKNKKELQHMGKILQYYMMISISIAFNNQLDSMVSFLLVVSSCI